MPTAVQMFPPTVLTTSPQTLYIVPEPTTNILMRGMMRFSNTGTVSATVSAYDIVPSGTLGVVNTFLDQANVASLGTLDVSVPVIAAGGTLQAVASVGAVVSVHSLDGIIFP